MEAPKDSSVNVFLGGSCNPTTWRTDIAIPFLKKHGITFYNPQVDDWRPELMAMEAEAKDKADILLFVIDNQTRSTASMVEVAYLAGRGRKLVLVMRPFGQNACVAGESLSASELKELQRSRDDLAEMMKLHDIPVFSDMHSALAFTRNQLQNKDGRVQQDESFDAKFSSRVRLPDFRPTFDVYLGGTTCRRRNWREEAAAELSGHGLTCAWNRKEKTENETSSYQPPSVGARLLYVIAADTRGIGSICEAAHSVGLGRRPINLCVQNISQGAVVDGETLTSFAVKDYNRARSYLLSAAREAGITINSDIEEAVKCTVNAVRELEK